MVMEKQEKYGPLKYTEKITVSKRKLMLKFYRYLLRGKNRLTTKFSNMSHLDNYKAGSEGQEGAENIGITTEVSTTEKRTGV